MINTISETDSKDKITEKLSDSWHESGIEKGDIVLIHSSLSSFLKEYKAKNIFITPSCHFCYGMSANTGSKT